MGRVKYALNMPKRPHWRKPAEQQRLAREDIVRLFQEAEQCKDLRLCNRYAQLATKIALKHKVKIPLPYKRRFCKHCLNYLRPGENCRIRTREGRIVYYCLTCKKYMRVPYK